MNISRKREKVWAVHLSMYAYEVEDNCVKSQSGCLGTNIFCDFILFYFWNIMLHPSLSNLYLCRDKENEYPSIWWNR